MNLLDVLTAPWAIVPEKLLEIQAIYAARLAGEPADLAALEQRLGRPLANEPRAYQVVDGVALLPVQGVMAKRANLFTSISGGVSTELAARDVRAATADASVHSLIVQYDSPGGAADGLQLLISAVRDARAAGKRVVSHADGMIASAAYWTGSAGEAVYLADTITQVGSIGVVATHRDLSAARAEAGIKVTEIVAGKYKRVASENGPLSEEGRQTLQAAVDYFYSVFVGDVAAHRGVTVERVLADMADGRVFIGEQALSAGLADGVASVEQLVEQLNRERSSRAPTGRAAARLPALLVARAASAPPALPSHRKGSTMSLTRDQLAAEAPELLATVQAEAATAERDRIRAVEAQAMPGHDALIASLKFDGKTTGPEAAVAVLNAEREARARGAAQLAADAPPPVKPVATPAVEAKPEAKTKAQVTEDAKRLAAAEGIPFLDAVKRLGYAGVAG